MCRYEHACNVMVRGSPCSLPHPATKHPAAGKFQYPKGVQRLPPLTSDTMQGEEKKSNEEGLEGETANCKTGADTTQGSRRTPGWPGTTS